MSAKSSVNKFAHQNFAADKIDKKGRKDTFRDEYD